MITDRLKGTFAGQKITYSSFLFGKNYFWMQDGDGTIYLAKNVDGKPDFS